MDTLALILQQTHIFLARYPTKYKVSAAILAILLGIAEWEHPHRFLPTFAELFGAGVAIVCGTAVIGLAITLNQCFETANWPWDHEGPMEDWFWGLWEDSGSASEAGEVRTGSPHAGEVGREAGFAPASRTSPFLPGLPPSEDLSPATHRSGLLGESPTPIRFEHFSGEYFHTRIKAFQAMKEYTSPHTGQAKCMAMKDSMAALREYEKEEEKFKSGRSN